jgi:diguanylate cyclase (GGDEF)-like protein
MPTRSARRFRHCWPLLAVWPVCAALSAAPTSASDAALKTVPPSTAQVRTLMAQADDELERDPDAALRILERARAMAVRLGDDALRRDVLVDICDARGVLAPAAAQAEAEAGLREAKAASDGRALAGFHACRGASLDRQGHPAEAAIEYESAVAEAERSESRDVLADALAVRGESRHYQGRYDEAIADLDRAYALGIKLGLVGEQRYALNAIANVYSDENVGEYDKAITYYRQLLEQDRAANARLGEATTRYNIASALEKKGAYAQALPEYRQALETYTAAGDRSSIAETERAIGSLLVRQGKAAEALPWIERAQGRFADLGDEESLERCRLPRARALRALGRLREAGTELDLAERHFRTSNNPRFLAKIYAEMAELHAAAGEWRKAYEASVAYRNAQAQLDRRAREEQTSRLRVQFDTAKKEQENRALLIENAHRGEALRSAERMRTLQRLTIMLGAALLLLLGMMALQQLQKGHRLRLLAMTDDLTGLPNRRGILDALERGLSAHREDGRPLSVAVFDIDHFKRINDAHGHHGGDRVLEAIAAVARARTPEGASVGRLGGEEFLMVLPGMDAAAARQVAEALREAVSGSALGLTGDATRVTISLGVAGAQSDERGESLLRRADDALYRAKREGRDRTEMG